MEAQVGRLQEMSETLESSGFSQQQSNAVIKSVALAMETFSVTPEILEAQLAKERKETNGRFDETDRRFDETDRRLDEIPELRKDVRSLSDRIDDLKRDMLGHQRSMQRYFMAFTLMLFGALVASLIAM